MERIDVDADEVFAALANQPSPIQPKRFEALIREGDAILARPQLQRVKSAESVKSPIPQDATASPRGGSWPDPPAPSAYAGLAGEYIEMVSGYCESDPVAILGQVLAAVGNAVGRGPHLMLGATRHGANINVANVGRTAKARKSDSWAPVRLVMSCADSRWTDRILGGLASGEGLIWAVRDDDENNTDKRAFVYESEFGRVITSMRRQGSILSHVIREAWDGGRLRTLTKNSPAVATDAHISIVANITGEELRRDLDDTSYANGFANRFLWLAVRRSKLIAVPEPLDQAVIASMVPRFASVIHRGKKLGRIPLDAGAEGLWRDLYPDLTAEGDGLVGAILSRSETQVLRLALIYALLAGAEAISAENITSGLALVDYCRRSVEVIFGNSTGDPVADLILGALTSEERLSRTEIYNLFGRHESSARIAHSLRLLEEKGRLQKTTEATGGRPAEWWSRA